MADAKALGVTVRDDIIRPLVEYNFGPDANVPFIRFNSDEKEDQKEEVDTYRTLACDIGLKIPASHVYKKFNIPEPEDGEEVLQPNMVTRTHILGEPSEGMDQEGQEQMKDDQDAAPEQLHLDEMTDLSEKMAASLIGKMWEPLKDFVDSFDGDISQLQEAMKDPSTLEKLYEQMESPEFTDLLHQTIYLSSVIGRTQE